MKKINNKVLVSGADYFNDGFAINELMDSSIAVDLEKAKQEHNDILKAFTKAGIEVLKVDPPESCQDGIYTANWALVRNGKAIMARLPNVRKPEESYAKEQLKMLGIETLELPEDIKSFSGQGDALVVDNIVFTQYPYRTDKKAHPYLKSLLGIEKVVVLHTLPAKNFLGFPKKNKITGWPDSPTYDIDLALAIIKPADGDSKPLIAYCPDVFDAESQRTLEAMKEVDKIKVSKKEALESFALNLVSTGEHVIMNANAPEFKGSLEKNGLKITELRLPELQKGGGSIRCTSLALS